MGFEAAEFGLHLDGFEDVPAPRASLVAHEHGGLVLREFLQEVVEREKLVGIEAFDQIVKGEPELKIPERRMRLRDRLLAHRTRLANAGGIVHRIRRSGLGRNRKLRVVGLTLAGVELANDVDLVERSRFVEEGLAARLLRIPARQIVDGGAEEVMHNILDVGVADHLLPGEVGGHAVQVVVELAVDFRLNILRGVGLHSLLARLANLLQLAAMLPTLRTDATEGAIPFPQLILLARPAVFGRKGCDDPVLDDTTFRTRTCAKGGDDTHGAKGGGSHAITSLSATRCERAICNSMRRYELSVREKMLRELLIGFTVTNRAMNRREDVYERGISSRRPSGQHRT